MEPFSSCRTCAGIPEPGISLLDPSQQKLAKWAQLNIPTVKVSYAATIGGTYDMLGDGFS